MVTTTQKPAAGKSISTEPRSLDEWLESPLKGTEWVKGSLQKKTGMTLTHSRVQGTLCYYWRCYVEGQQLGGQVYTEPPCQTIGRQARKPDVAYLTPELSKKHCGAKVLPQSFPLSAEIVSPTDAALDVFDKAEEYLVSGGEEVWLVFPESALVIVLSAESKQIFGAGETVTSQRVLPGFSVAVDDLLA